MLKIGDKILCKKSLLISGTGVTYKVFAGDLCEIISVIPHGYYITNVWHLFYKGSIISDVSLDKGWIYTNQLKNFDLNYMRKKKLERILY